VRAKLDQQGFIVQMGVDENISAPCRFDTLETAARRIAECCIETSHRAGRPLHYCFAVGVVDDPDYKITKDLGQAIGRCLREAKGQL